MDYRSPISDIYDEPLISDTYPSSGSLLDAVAIYYPTQFDLYKLDTVKYVGNGADAYCFFYPNGSVVKFTQNQEHAKVSWKLCKENITNLSFVETFEVKKLCALGLYMIREERLCKLSPKEYDNLDAVLTGRQCHPKYSKIIDKFVIDLHTLKILDYDLDCLAAHNIMKAVNTSELKLMDFGYTKTTFSEDYEVWR